MLKRLKCFFCWVFYPLFCESECCDEGKGLLENKNEKKEVLNVEKKKASKKVSAKKKASKKVSAKKKAK